MKRAILRGVLGTVLGALLCAGTAHAVTFQTGDVFAAVGSGQVQHWRPSTNTLLATYNTTRGGFTTGMAFDSSGNLYVTNFSDGSISVFDNSGALVNPLFVSGLTGNAPESIVFDAAGNFYVGQADGTRDILKYNSAGVLQGAFNVATDGRGSDWIDLAADQKTMFYTSEGRRVLRYDVSTSTQLADFAALSGSGTAFAMRILADGGILVADSGLIRRLSSGGVLLQTYDVLGHDNWFGLNLDPDATSFWSGDYGTGQFHRFDIATGALLDSETTGSGDHYGLAVFGEITQGTAPEPATTSLMGLGLAALGILLRRRRSS